MTRTVIDYRSAVLAQLEAADGPLTVDEIVRALALSLPAREREAGRTICAAPVYAAVAALIADGLVAGEPVTRTQTAFRGILRPVDGTYRATAYRPVACGSKRP